MSEMLLESSVEQMLGAFGQRPSAERVKAFVEVVLDEQMCELCAARAAKNLTASSKRPPFPVHLVEETHEVQGSAEHLRHIQNRAVLGPGDLAAWWVTEGPVLVRKAWPELTSEQSIEVARELAKLGYVAPTYDSIATELGFDDAKGPTNERVWWHRHMPHLVPSGEDPRYV